MRPRAVEPAGAKSTCERSASLFDGPGDIRSQCRSIDWGATSLRAIDAWPQSLTTAVQLCLDARFPMAVWAGPDLILLYNEGYVPVLGVERHPWALGRPAREVWPALWERLGPELVRVVRNGQSTFHEDERFVITRNGTTAEAYFTYSFTPIRDEAGCPVGALNVFQETTSRLVDAEEREAFMSFALSTANAGAWELDLDGGSASRSRVHDQIFGYEQPLPEWNYEIFLAHVLADDRPEVDRVFRRAVESRGACSFECRIRRLDGSVRWIWVSGRHRTDAGKRRRMAGIVQDITERKQAEQALQASEARYRTMHEGMRDAFVQVDMQGHLVDFNDLYCQMLGYSPEELRALTYQQLTPEEWHAFEAGIVRDQILPRGFSQVYEKEYRRKDGSVFPVELRTILVRDGAGRPQGMWGLVRDITARKAAERTQRKHEQTITALVERAPFGIYVVDSQFRIAHMNIGSQNGAFCSVRPVIGRDFSEAMRILWPEPVAAGIIAAFRRTLETGEPFVSPRFTNPRADVVRTESYEWELHRIELPDGQSGVVCYYFDSTELRNAEEALRNADRRKDEFLATLAHELRNPLAPIRQAAAIGRSPAATPAQVRWGLEVIERQTKHMAVLLDELLDVSRITRGKIKLDVSALVLNEVVDAAIETARPSIELRAHRLDVALPEEPLALNGDRLRLAQVISNLLTNAAKYTEPGGRIRLSARRDGDTVEMAVTDNGIGIPPDQLERVFEMFAQGHAPLHSREDGLGVGLALARGLVVLHGGTIEARSDGVGRGSTFVVRLPLEGRAVETQRDASRDRAATRWPKRILVVDDNADAADSLAALLRLEGHEVEVATDGAVALRVADVFRPDVVLLDVGMPGVSGLEVARRLRSTEEGRGALLVAITGWGQAEDRRSTKAAGFDYHLTKPVDPDTLAEIIGRSLKT